METEEYALARSLRISPIVMVDNVNFDVQMLDKFSGCYNGISSLENVCYCTVQCQIKFKIGESCKVTSLFMFQHQSLQQLMLMTDNRQLFLVDGNLWSNETNLEVQKFHHPLSIFSAKEGSGVVTQVLACRNGLLPGVNAYISSSWILPFTVNPLDLERYLLQS